jgi:hypothetical protein
MTLLRLGSGQMAAAGDLRGHPKPVSYLPLG